MLAESRRTSSVGILINLVVSLFSKTIWVGYFERKHKKWDAWLWNLELMFCLHERNRLITHIITAHNELTASHHWFCNCCFLLLQLFHLFCGANCLFRCDCSIQSDNKCILLNKTSFSLSPPFALYLYIFLLFLLLFLYFWSIFSSSLSEHIWHMCFAFDWPRVQAVVGRCDKFVLACIEPCDKILSLCNMCHNIALVGCLMFRLLLLSCSRIDNWLSFHSLSSTILDGNL